MRSKILAVNDHLREPACHRASYVPVQPLSPRSNSLSEDLSNEFVAGPATVPGVSASDRICGMQDAPLPEARVEVADRTWALPC